DDGQLYDWAEAARIDLAEDKPRQLRPVDPPLPESGEIRGRDLRFADLRGVELNRLKFVDCDLSGAVFDDADIHRTMFKNCDLTSTSWRNVSIGAGDSAVAINSVVGCDLTGADFTKAQARNLRLVNSTADKIQFGLAELSGLHISNTTLTNTDWSGTDIKSATVVDCQLDAT
ncbi:pentapeptide repeat-containing protein, partial [Corynebacterium casei]